MKSWFELRQYLGTGHDPGIAEKGLGALLDLGIIGPKQAAASLEVQVELAHPEAFFFQCGQEDIVVGRPVDQIIAGQGATGSAERGPTLDEPRGDLRGALAGQLSESRKLDFLCLLEAEQPCKIILVMREEFFGQLYYLEKEIPTIYDFRMRVEPMVTMERPSRSQSSRM